MSSDEETLFHQFTNTLLNFGTGVSAVDVLEATAQQLGLTQLLDYYKKIGQREQDEVQNRTDRN